MNEVKTPAEIKGKKGHVWVVGIDTDPGYEEAAKLLSHSQGEFSEDAHGGWPQIDEFLAGLFRAGRRVFFVERAETDRYGLPKDSEIVKALDQAICEVARATGKPAQLITKVTANA